MQRHQMVLVIGSIAVLLGFSAVLAIQEHQESVAVDKRTQRTVAVDPKRADAGPREEPQAASQATGAAPDTINVAQPNPEELSTRARVRPKDQFAPEHRAAHRAEERMVVRREYGQLFETLALSAQQEEEFLEVLVADGVAEPTNLAEWRANRAQRRRDQLDKLADIVGHDRANVIEEYQRNLAEHTRVTQIAMQLDASGSQLSKQQKQYLAQLMIAERDRIPQPSTQKAIATAADVEREIEWMSDQDRRIREGAASMLSPAQLKYLDEFLTARFARRRVELYAIPVIG